MPSSSSDVSPPSCALRRRPCYLVIVQMRVVVDEATDTIVVVVAVMVLAAGAGAGAGAYAGDPWSCLIVQVVDAGGGCG